MCPAVWLEARGIRRRRLHHQRLKAVLLRGNGDTKVRGLNHRCEFHLYLIPGLEFVDESLAAYERFFDTPIPAAAAPEPDLDR